MKDGEKNDKGQNDEEWKDDKGNVKEMMRNEK